MPPPNVYVVQQRRRQIKCSNDSPTPFLLGSWMLRTQFGFCPDARFGCLICFVRLFAVACYRFELPAVVPCFWYLVTGSLLMKGGSTKATVAVSCCRPFLSIRLFVIHCYLMLPHCHRHYAGIFSLFFILLSSAWTEYIFHVLFCVVQQKSSPCFFVYLFLFRTSVVLFIAVFPCLSYPVLCHILQNTCRLFCFFFFVS